MGLSRLEYSAQSQSLGLEGIGNARELGGYLTQDGRVVRRGLLLRSAAPEAATEEDRRKLECDLHLSCVLDFRMDMEYQRLDASARGLDFATTDRVRILDEDYYKRMYSSIPAKILAKVSPAQLVVASIDMGVIDDRMYLGFLEAKTGRRGYAEVFERLLAQPENEAILFHCTQGKDRTGLAAMLVLSALGVDEETIIFDYMLTNTFNAELIEREREDLMAAGIPERRLDKYMLGFDQVFEQTMQNAIEDLKEEYGSVWGYIRDELGVSDADREDLRAKYLT